MVALVAGDFGVRGRNHRQGAGEKVHASGVEDQGSRLAARRRHFERRSDCCRQEARTLTSIAVAGTDPFDALSFSLGLVFHLPASTLEGRSTRNGGFNGPNGQRHYPSLQRS